MCAPQNVGQNNILFYCSKEERSMIKRLAIIACLYMYAGGLYTGVPPPPPPHLNIGVHCPSYSTQGCLLPLFYITGISNSHPPPSLALLPPALLVCMHVCACTVATIRKLIL